MPKNKSGLYLVSTAAVKKKFDMFFVFMADGSIFEYKLDEVRVSKDEEWIEVERIDKTCMEAFFYSNVVRVKFMTSIAKPVLSERKNPDLLPVA